MFEDAGCEWCQRWNKEVGDYYKDSDIGQSVPLRRVEISEPRPAPLKAIANIQFTPTFVVVHDGREIGRIVGYPGEDFFWGYLEQIVAKIKPAPKRKTN